MLGNKADTFSVGKARLSGNLITILYVAVYTNLKSRVNLTYFDLIRKTHRLVLILMLFYSCLPNVSKQDGLKNFIFIIKTKEEL